MLERQPDPQINRVINELCEHLRHRAKDRGFAINFSIHEGNAIFNITFAAGSPPDDLRAEAEECRSFRPIADLDELPGKVIASVHAGQAFDGISDASPTVALRFTDNTFAVLLSEFSDDHHDQVRRMTMRLVDVSSPFQLVEAGLITHAEYEKLVADETRAAKLAEYHRLKQELGI